jgi:hypothetical protein
LAIRARPNGEAMIFALAFLMATASMIAAWRGSRPLALAVFGATLAAMLMIYMHHATDILPLSF